MASSATAPIDHCARLAGMLLLCAAASLGAGCPSNTPDGGTTCGEGPARIEAGETGLEWVPLPASGATLPAWRRPQGGIGTRVNVQIFGYPESHDFELLRVRITGVRPDGQQPNGTWGGSCRMGEELDAGSPFVELADGGLVDAGAREEIPVCDRPTRCADVDEGGDDTCEFSVVSFSFTRFPRTCQPSGGLLAPEVPIRFRSYLELEDVDGLDAELLVEVEDDDGNLVSQTTPVRLIESDFIDPSTFDPLG